MVYIGGVSILSFLVIGHIVGTVMGAGGALFAEIFHIKSLKEGKFDETLGSMLKTVYTIMRIGIVLIVLSGFGFFILFRLDGHADRLYSDIMWAKMLLTIIILGNAVFMQMKLMPMWLGAALSIVSWYFALGLGILRREDYSFFGIMIVYVVTVFVVAFVLDRIKQHYIARTTPPATI
jgi:hypothetical protein